MASPLDRSLSRGRSGLEFRRSDEAIVWHGMAVALIAPEAFRSCFDVTAERQLTAARLLAPDVEASDDPADRSPGVLVDLMRYSGRSQRHRVGFSEDDIAGILTRSVENW